MESVYKLAPLDQQDKLKKESLLKTEDGNYISLHNFLLISGQEKKRFPTTRQDKLEEGLVNIGFSRFNPLYVSVENIEGVVQYT